MPGLGSFACVAISVLAGTISALSFSVLSWASYLEQKEPGKPRKCWARPVNLVLSLVGSLCFIWATTKGPVALAMPCQTAAQLIANMLLEMLLVKKNFNNQRRVGTFIVAVAIAELIDVGPKPIDAKDQDVFSLIFEPPAIAFEIFLVCAFVIGIILLWCEKRRTKNSGAVGTLRTDPLRQGVANNHTHHLLAVKGMVGYLLAQASTIVATTSIGKCLGLFTVGWHKYLTLAAYIAISAITVIVATWAAERVDMSVYVPLYAFTKLSINCFAGICIWQDWKTITSWVAYPCVYLMMLLGVYLLSEVDLVEAMASRRWHRANADSALPQTATGDALAVLIDVWADGSEIDEESQQEAFEGFLKAGVKSGGFAIESLVDLAVIQQGEAVRHRLNDTCKKGIQQSQAETCSSNEMNRSSVLFPGLACWIHKNVHAEPALIKRLQQVEVASNNTLPGPSCLEYSLHAQQSPLEENHMSA